MHPRLAVLIVKMQTGAGPLRSVCKSRARIARVEKRRSRSSVSSTRKAAMLLPLPTSSTPSAMAHSLALVKAKSMTWLAVTWGLWPSRAVSPRSSGSMIICTLVLSESAQWGTPSTGVTSRRQKTTVQWPRQYRSGLCPGVVGRYASLGQPGVSQVATATHWFSAFRKGCVVWQRRSGVRPGVGDFIFGSALRVHTRSLGLVLAAAPVQSGRELLGRESSRLSRCLAALPPPPMLSPGVVNPFVQACEASRAGSGGGPLSPVLRERGEGQGWIAGGQVNYASQPIGGPGAREVTKDVKNGSRRDQ